MRPGLEPIRAVSHKRSLILIFVTLLGSIFLQTLGGAALSVQTEQTSPEDVFKFKTRLVREELLKSGFEAHYLRKNETLYRLSVKYFVSLPALASLNRITNPRLIPEGRKLYIPPVDYHSGRLKDYRVKNGDTLGGILSRFGLELWQFKRLNPGWDRQSLKPGAVLILPVKEINRSLRSSNLINLFRPVAGHLTSRFGFRWGRMHYGIDLAAPFGTPVRAAASGVIRFTGWKGGYGFLVKINHGRYNTYYGHLSKILVSTGSCVRKGDLIGLVGATGQAYGTHLHFELEVGGAKIDPTGHLRQF